MTTYKDVLMLVDKVTEPLKKIQNNTDKLRDKFGKLRNGVKNVTKALSVIGVAVGVVGGAILRASKGVADYGDRIDKMSQKIGMSREAFQEWDYILSQNGGNIDSLQMGFKTLTTQIGMAGKGSKESVAMFKRLGVSIKDNNGNLRKQDDVFNDTITALQKMGETTERDVIAQKLFGRSFIEVKPLLNQSAEAIDKLRKKANDMGLILSKEDVDNARDFKDTMDTFTRFFQAKFATVMMKLMPSFSQALDEIIKFTQENQQVFDDLGAAFSFIVTKALPMVLRGFFGLANAIRGVGAVLGNLIGDILSFPILVQTGFIKVQNIILKIFLAIRSGVSGAIQFILDKMALLLNTIASVANKIPLLKGLGNMLSGVANNINRNSVRQTQNNTTNNSSTVYNYNYGNQQQQTISNMLNPNYIAPAFP